MPAFEEAVLTDEFRNNPYPVYERLRTEDPVHWSDAWGCWVLTRYEDIVRVLQDSERFSSRGRVTNVIQKTYPAEFILKVQPLLSHFAQGLINSDPPDHTRLRRLIQKTFLPRTLERLRPRVQAIVNELLNRVQASGQMDLVKDLSYPLPVVVIAELLGVPKEMRDHFKEWSATILEFQAVPKADPAVILRSQKALLECREYLRAVVQERRSAPRDDLISELATVEDQGDMLTEEELLSTGVSLLVAGHETTTNLIASAVWLLLRHRDQFEKLRCDASLLASAIEEVLRYESPLQRVGRTALADAEICGRVIPRGQSVLSLLGAANRDPAQFPAADTFDIRRAPNRHIAFGSGPHFCVGAALARLEAPIAIHAVLERLRSVKVETGKLEWNNGVMRGLKALPLKFEPGCE